MTERHLLPAGGLSHLPPAIIEADWELRSLARLLELGGAWAGLALPPSFEEGFYRLNNLPHQLAPLYRGLDPNDPDEDIVEEAEHAAQKLVGQHYLLDESVDLLYESLPWQGAITVRRPGAQAGHEVRGRRAALLAIKHTFQDDWSAAAVMERLARSHHLGIEARPVLLTPGDERPDAALAGSASRQLGQPVGAFVDASGTLVRLAPA